ncbi:MAG: hypothetical protein JXA91_08580 [Candidatus Thermoplasmatota archaeon]|nr:hypothetical protein [Candidatus Thermoplasmatota archaeon]
MIKLDLKKLNIFTIFSLLLLLAGILFYIYWGIRFGVWYDVGIYSITIVLVLGGFLGTILTLMETSQD